MDLLYNNIVFNIRYTDQKNVTPKFVILMKTVFLEKKSFKDIISKMTEQFSNFLNKAYELCS